MHDLKFANEAIFILKRETAKLGKAAESKPIIVNIALSPLSHVKPEGFRETFKHMLSHEAPFLTDVRLNITPMQFDLYCKACKKLSKVNEPTFQCPSCNSADLDVEMGKEFFVDSIEVEGME
jgi:Zn finger protein HypA/HybF involved in hydrogenase expression